MFEQNGNLGEAAYVHPHFIRYLRYFLFGPYLPSAVSETFEKEIDDRSPVTSGDIVPLGDLARKLTRRNFLDRDGAALAFYKLCLDIGLAQWIARSVRDSVMQIQRSQRESTW